MKQDHVGTVEQHGEEYTLLLEREYPLPIERVWAALVEPEKLKRWLGVVEIDPRVGGSFLIDFNGTDKAGGEILAYEPPRLLEFDWGEMGEPSVVRFELAESDRGTQLRLVHTRQSAGMAAGTAPGWHAHLEVFEIVLGDGEFDLDADYHDLYEAAKPLYAGVVPAESP